MSTDSSSPSSPSDLESKKPLSSSYGSASSSSSPSPTPSASSSDRDSVSNYHSTLSQSSACVCNLKYFHYTLPFFLVIIFLFLTIGTAMNQWATTTSVNNNANGVKSYDANMGLWGACATVYNGDGTDGISQCVTIGTNDLQDCVDHGSTQYLFGGNGQSVFLNIGVTAKHQCQEIGAGRFFMLMSIFLSVIYGVYSLVMVTMIGCGLFGGGDNMKMSKIISLHLWDRRLSTFLLILSTIGFAVSYDATVTSVTVMSGSDFQKVLYGDSAALVITAIVLECWCAGVAWNALRVARNAKMEMMEGREEGRPLIR